MEIGKYNTLSIARKTDHGLYLQDEDENEVLLPNKYVPHDFKLGEKLEVFIYLDGEQRPIATTLKPKAIAGDFAWLQVKHLSKVGAFLDWGLEKDLLVPFAEQEQRMQEGDFYVVYVFVDEISERLVASSRVEDYTEKEDISLPVDQEVDLLIARQTDLGYTAIIDNRYLGLLYANEVFKKIRTGQRLRGFVKKVRDDGKIDLSLEKQGYASVEPNAQKILEILARNNGFLPLHDKSDPDEIKRRLEMSKKTFKKAIGGLYKEKRITITENGIRLN